MLTISKTINEIRNLFEKQGDSDYYGEKVSQFQHAAQAALLAKNQGYGEEVQVAAFLHDIGHLLPASSDEELMEVYGRKNHEAVAADWLRARGFSDKVAVLIENHVNAKRYLCFKNSAYYLGLSEASKKTLEFQGGVMSTEEAQKFEQSPYFETIIQMRRWDEAAKVERKQIPNLEYFMAMCFNYLSQTHSTKTLNEIFF